MRNHKHGSFSGNSGQLNVNVPQADAAFKGAAGKIFSVALQPRARVEPRSDAFCAGAGFVAMRRRLVALQKVAGARPGFRGFSAARLKRRPFRFHDQLSLEAAH